MAGSVVPNLRLARRLKTLPTSRQLTVTLSLQIQDQAGLDSLLRQLYDPASPLYRHFLTPGQFAQRFAPSTSARAQAAQWLQSQGLTVTGTSANGLQIRARGSVARLQTAFATTLATYQKGGQSFFANTRAVTLPGSVAANVVAVSGLANTIRQQPAGQARLQAHLTPRGYAPSDVEGAYDLAPLRAQGLNGSGQTIAIATFADYSPDNVSTFDQQFGISGAPTRIAVDGGARLGASQGEDETEADIEMLQGTAPGAGILVYEAPNSATSNQTAIDLYSRIVSDDRAAVVTTSWGNAESESSNDDLNAMDQILQEAAAQGQAFFAASGDSGAYDDAGNGPGSDTQLAVDFPASDPWVTGIGGTTLRTNGSQYLSETAWSNSTSRTPEGTGGGLSSFFARPGYQTGPGVDNQYSDGHRQVPDVAADADPNTGYAVYTVGSRSSAGWGVIGGTSAAAPLWASFAAIVNQALGRNLGFLNPTLYALGQRASSFSPPPFHDVTTGTNLYYPATPGWDYATGWGSFDGAAFVDDVRALPASAVTVPPTSTPVPTATATPTIAIKQVILLHSVKGKLQPTTSLKVGETGTLVIVYQANHAGALKPNGSLALRAGGRLVKTGTLKATTYGGKPALKTTIRITAASLVGTVRAQVKVAVGAIVAAATRSFALRP